MKKRSDSYASVWDSLADTTEQAANLRARSDQMRQISEVIHDNDWKQVEAAQRCGVTQSRINDFLRGRVSRFLLDGLGQYRHRAWAPGEHRARRSVGRCRSPIER